MKSIDIGDMCTGCGRDTGPGSGLFVNRIPSSNDWYVGDEVHDKAFCVRVDGWLCIDCQAVPCHYCCEPMIDWVTVDIDGDHRWMCAECVDTHGFTVV